MYELYSLFGVPRAASDEEIKQAFRTLAKRYHPDTSEGAADKGKRFKDLSSAYEILGDPIKRRAYDRGEIDGYGNPRAGYTPRAEREPERERAREYRSEEKETAGAQRESARASNAGSGGSGASAAFRSAFEKAFGNGGNANGNGANGNATSTNGNGDARKHSRVEDLFSEFFGDRSTGKKRPAHGKGLDTSYDLAVTFEEAALGGTRRVKMPNGKRFDVRVPVGTREGQAIRLKGLGESGAAGGQDGDAMITVNIEPHPYFRRDGRDIHLDLPITLNEALHGAKVKVPTLHAPVTMVIPPGANAGQVFRLKGKGIPSHGIHAAGDQFVTLQVVMPEKPDPNLTDAIKKWEAANPYNPRKRFGDQ